MWQFLLVDLRCHDDSVSIKKRGPHTVALTALDVLKLIVQLRLAPRVLVGHSFGGKVALSMVEQAAKPPARPVKVWVLDATPGKVRAGVDGEDHPAKFIEFLRRMPMQVSGKVTYNGHEMNEFVPQRTAAYISQHDLHIGEMTVRETLAFSARCQGVGSRYEMLIELVRREKAENIKPDHDIDVYMKASAMAGQESSVVTEYILKILGLDICADTVVGNEMLRGVSLS